MSEEDNLRFSETLSDFASLIQELGPERVYIAFRSYFPDECKGLTRSINSEQRAALFRPPRV